MPAPNKGFVAVAGGGIHSLGLKAPCPGDLDYTDVDGFANCMTGPDTGPAPPECDCSDFDGDTDIDLADFAEFQTQFGS